MNLSKKPTPEQIEAQLYNVKTLNVVLCVIVATMAFPLIMLWNANSANKELIAEYSKGRIVNSPTKEEVRYIVQPRVEKEKDTYTEAQLLNVQLSSCMEMGVMYKGIIDVLIRKR